MPFSVLPSLTAAVAIIASRTGNAIVAVRSMQRSAEQARLSNVPRYKSVGAERRGILIVNE